MGHVDLPEELKLGVPAMDADHSRLTALSAEFLEAVQGDAGPARLCRVLGELIARTRVHFQSEETLMDRVGYPGLTKHKADHQRLLLEAQTLYDRFVAHGADPAASAENERRLAEEAGEYLQQRLIEHVRGEDRGFRPYVMRLG